MMLLQLLSVFQFVIISCSSLIMAYPIYGTKRYGRSSVRRLSSPYANPYQQMLRTQRHPMNYYDLYPYTQNYPDDYYYAHESYPIYYPRTSKYEVYQAVLPYYYQDGPSARPGYGYYGYDDNDRLVDVQDELMQEAEREQREDSQPIGQEMLYENEDNKPEESLDDVNAAFLQNLIMSQMYKDAVDKQKDYYDSEPYSDYSGEDIYGKWEDAPAVPKQSYKQEDEDVRELKQLAKSKNKQDTDDMHWYQNRKYKIDNNNWDTKRNTIKIPNLKKEEFSEHGPRVYVEKDIAFTDRKPSVKASTTNAPTTAIDDTKPGQKEEVLARPATPVRHFSPQNLDMLTKNDKDHKRVPSVYDTIKHMLDMEKNLENKYSSEEAKAPMRKRIISSEESLTQQLSVLKKGQ